MVELFKVFFEGFEYEIVYDFIVFVCGLIEVVISIFFEVVLLVVFVVVLFL